MNEKKKRISRRDFLRGAGAVAAGAVVLGALGACAAGGDTAAAETPVPLPDHTPMPEPEPTPEKPIVPAAGPSSYAGGATVLAFASDQHAETPGFAAWIADQKAVYGDDLAFLSFGGDICDKAWTPEVFDGFKAALDEAMPGKYGVTTGNQEHKAGAPVWDPAVLGPGFLRLGEAARGDDYRVYFLGAAQEAMAFPAEDIAALAAYLDEQPASLPVFVVSHFPLHLSVPYSGHDIPGGYRMTLGNDALTEVLNAHPNVIFLWGHNHTFMDPRYGTIRPAGSKFTWNIEDVTRKLTIGFTYANLGSFCRGSTYGCIAELRRTDAGVETTMYYVDTNVPMLTKESAVITVAPDGSVTADVKTSDSTNYIDMFYLAGWYEDPSFAADY